MIGRRGRQLEGKRKRVKTIGSKEKNLEAGKLPRRKNPCIWVLEGGCLRVLAHFKSQAAYEEFKAFNPMYTPVRSDDDH